MLLSALFSGSILQIAVTIVAAVFLIFALIPLHEFSHAFVAYKLGDNTVKLRGRLTLDPLAHLDPMGTVLLVLIGFGWGKPCPIDSRNFKNPKRDLALVSAAGPLSSILLAWILIFIRTVIFVAFPKLTGVVIGQAIDIFFTVTSQISVYLAVLNLLPIPMFDGFTILVAFLPPEVEYKIYANQQIISIVIMVLLFTRVLTTPVAWLSTFVLKFLYFISALPFSALH